jgi:hypothetical protein
VQRIAWLIQGRIRADGDAAALAAHVEPATARASALLDRIVGPTSDGRVELVAWTSSPDVLRRLSRRGGAPRP